MPNLVYRQGPEGYIPSGESQGPSAEQRLQSMMEMMQGAPNSVLMMIARILGRDQQPQQQPQQQMPPDDQWQQLYPMPPVYGPAQFPGINAGKTPAPMRPSDPPMMVNPNPGWIRG